MRWISKAKRMKTQMSDKTKKQVLVRFDPEDAALIDRAAKADGHSRENFIRHYSLRKAKELMATRRRTLLARFEGSKLTPEQKPK